MRIREVEIKNFRSLRNIKLENLGDLIILIGPNGSGKSNILEALELFFADLNLATDVEKQALPELWFDKRTDVPISIRVSIELQSFPNWDDLNQLFTKDVLSALKLEEVPTQGRMLVIHRQIFKKVWKNVQIDLRPVFSVTEGKVTFNKGILSRADAGTQGKVTESEQTPPEPDSALEPGIAQTLLTSLTALLKNEFKLIRGPRESTERPTVPARPAILDAESKSFFTSLALEKDRAKEEKWNEYVDEFEKFSNRRMQVRGTEIEFRQRDLVLPLELSGSGDQAILILMRQFNNPMYFYGIEEPETRLHHDYVRKLSHYLKNVSEDWQVFLSTHSPVFVDKAFLQNTWFVRIQGKETKITRVEKEELRNILLELGVKPSDFFFANQLLLVEGRAEEELLPALSEKAGIEISNLKILPVKGKQNTKYHLRVWLEAAGETGIPVFALLDKNARAEADEMIRGRKIDRDNCMVLDKESLSGQSDCDIEDYYPRELLLTGLDTLYPKTADWAKVLEEDQPVASRISASLKTERWKAPLARYVGQHVEKAHLDNEFSEIIRFLRRIAPRVRENTSLSS